MTLRRSEARKHPALATRTWWVIDSSGESSSRAGKGKRAKGIHDLGEYRVKKGVVVHRALPLHTERSVLETPLLSFPAPTFPARHIAEFYQDMPMWWNCVWVVSVGALLGICGSALLALCTQTRRVTVWCEVCCGIGMLPLVVAPERFHGKLTISAVTIAWLVCLAVADLKFRRLPNTLTYTGIVVMVVHALCLKHGGIACLTALCFAGIYGVIHYVHPPAMGVGDVKLAAALGALCGRDDFLLVIPLIGLSSLFSGVAALWLVGFRRTQPSTSVAHGTSMCLAMYVVLVTASS